VFELGERGIGHRAAARYSSVMPSTWSKEATPRISSALVDSGVAAMSMVRATWARAVSARTFDDVSAVEMTMRSPV
jgi:cyclopropane fatty-acyl-phospholipid synthase-like methyltransferase